MKLVIRESAAADLEAIYYWIANDNPRAAEGVVRRVREKLNLLLVPGMTEIGRRGRVAGTRELIEEPYVIVYQVDNAEVVVVAVFHGARAR